MKPGAWAMLWLAGCGERLYASCEEPADCAVPEEATAECIDKSGEGFCTWKCAGDDDCTFDQDDYGRVCASFESEDELYCFPACRDDLEDDDPEVCPRGFGCRSTGGGSDNRRVCFPGELEDAPESPRD